MRVKTYDEPHFREQVFELRLTDIDLASSINSRELMGSVRAMLAKAIADKIMEAIGPVIDDAVAKFKQGAERSATT